MQRVAIPRQSKVCAGRNEGVKRVGTHRVKSVGDSTTVQRLEEQLHSKYRILIDRTPAASAARVVAAPSQISAAYEDTEHDIDCPPCRPRLDQGLQSRGEHQTTLVCHFSKDGLNISRIKALEADETPFVCLAVGKQG